MNWRKYHRIVSLIILLPLALTVLSGIVLQLRNQFEGIQPKSLSSELKINESFLTFETILKTHGDDKVEQIILRPGKRNLSLRMKDGMEIQIHPQTGEILKTAPRRTNFLIDLHQGSWLGSFGQYFVNLPMAIGLLFLIISGVVIYPFKKRRAR